MGGRCRVLEQVRRSGQGLVSQTWEANSYDVLPRSLLEVLRAESLEVGSRREFQDGRYRLAGAGGLLGAEQVVLVSQQPVRRV